MSLISIEILKLKQKALQIKQQVTNKIETEFNSWLELYDLFNKHQIPFQIIYLACVRAEEIITWIDYVEELQKKGYNLTKDQLLIAEYDVIPTIVRKTFPTQPDWLIHYVPTIDLVTNQENDFKKCLESCIEKIQISGTVVLFFGKVSPIISLSIDDLIKLVNNIDLHWFETMYVTNENVDWLIFCSHDQHWYAGYK